MSTPNTETLAEGVERKYPKKFGIISNFYKRWKSPEHMRKPKCSDGSCLTILDFESNSISECIRVKVPPPGANNLGNYEIDPLIEHGSPQYCKVFDRLDLIPETGLRVIIWRARHMLHMNPELLDLLSFHLHLDPEFIAAHLLWCFRAAHERYYENEEISVSLPSKRQYVQLIVHRDTFLTASLCKPRSWRQNRDNSRNVDERNLQSAPNLAGTAGGNTLVVFALENENLNIVKALEDYFRLLQQTPSLGVQTAPVSDDVQSRTNTPSFSGAPTAIDDFVSHSSLAESALLAGQSEIIKSLRFDAATPFDFLILYMGAHLSEILGWLLRHRKINVPPEFERINMRSSQRLDATLSMRAGIVYSLENLKGFFARKTANIGLINKKELRQMMHEYGETRKSLTSLAGDVTLRIQQEQHHETKILANYSTRFAFVAAIFLPLSVAASIFGMNVKPIIGSINIGYFVVCWIGLIVLAVVSFGIAGWFPNWVQRPLGRFSKD